MKSLHGKYYLRKERRSIGIAFLILTMLFPDSAFPLSLYLKDHILDRNGIVRLEDIALLKDAGDGYGKKVVVRNLDRPHYIKAEALKERLLKIKTPVSNVYGKGVWIIPLRSRLSDNQIRDLIREEISDKPQGETLLRNYSIIPVSGQEIFSVPGYNSMGFSLPGDITRLKSGRRVFPLDVISSDGKGNRKVIYRQNVTFDIRSKEISKNVRMDGDPKNSHSDSVGSDILIRKGEKISAVYAGKSVLMSLQGVSGGNGRKDDIISVKLLFPSGKSSDDIKARIVSEGVVQIENSNSK